MSRFVQGEDRRQDYLLPASLDDYVSEDNPVRAIEAFIDALDLKALEFFGMTPAETGRPAYHPATMLKIYLYGYLNRAQSSRRLEREAQRNVELMWLTGRLAPDFKTIANFRQANSAAIQSVCSQFIVLCRRFYTACPIFCRMASSAILRVGQASEIMRRARLTLSDVPRTAAPLTGGIAAYARPLASHLREPSRTG